MLAAENVCIGVLLGAAARPMSYKVLLHGAMHVCGAWGCLLGTSLLQEVHAYASAISFHQAA